MSSRERDRARPDPPRLTAPSSRTNFEISKEKGLAGARPGVAAEEGRGASRPGSAASSRGPTMRTSWTLRSPVNRVDQAKSR